MYYKDKNFGFFDYEELTKDLCHHKPLSFYFRAHSSHTRFQFSELVQMKSGRCSFNENTKIIHNMQNHTLVSNFGINNMRLYYGYKLPSLQPHQPQSTIVYSRLKSDRKLQNAAFTLGVQRRVPHLQIDTNMSIFLFERKNQYFLYGKLLYQTKHFNFGLLSIFDYGCTNLQTNNFVIEAKPHEKHQIFLRGEVDGLRNYSLKYSKIGNYFDYFILNYIYRPSPTLSLMAEVKYDVNANKIKNMQSIIEKRFAHNKLKFGLNQFGDIILQLQFPLSLGKGSNLDLGIQFGDILKNRRISYGIQINVNT